MSSSLGFLARLRKFWILRSYLKLGRLLVERYGADEHYSPGRVKTTLELARMSPLYLDHACAMYSAREDFIEWMQTRATERVDRVDQARLYAELRAECVEHNGGRARFLPARPSAIDAHDPIRNDSAAGMD